MARSTSYKESLYEALRDPREATSYLRSAIEEDDPAAFLLALRDVIDAHGGIGQLSKETELNRESLYRTFSKRGNPTYSNLKKSLDALGLRLSVERKRPAAKVAVSR